VGGGIGTGARTGQKSAVKVVADGVYTAKFRNKITYEGKRESDWR
jgi:hypothetical protein